MKTLSELIIKYRLLCQSFYYLHRLNNPAFDNTLLHINVMKRDILILIAEYDSCNIPNDILDAIEFFEIL